MCWKSIHINTISISAREVRLNRVELLVVCLISLRSLKIEKITKNLTKWKFEFDSTKFKLERFDCKFGNFLKFWNDLNRDSRFWLEVINKIE